MTVPFDLTCWYLNARRIVELTGLKFGAGFDTGASDHFQRLAELSSLRQAIVEWIRHTGPQPLDKLFLEEQLAEGRLFTLNTNFFFKGLRSFDTSSRGSRSEGLPIGYAKLDYLRPGLKVIFNFHPEHLTSNSSWVELSGQKRMFVLGVITEITDTEIKAKPYVIANLVESRGEFFAARRWANHLEVHIEQIDTFSLVRDVKPRMSKKSLEILKTIPEKDVKEAFAEIIGESHIPKDWGGEKSDLFTAALVVESQRVSTAFAFKGPAKFRPMTLAELGKNGDQINRLYEEPADLLVLQHCHEITTPVRRVMRSFAQQMSNPRTYCVIDGYDTLRLLRAYGKCGLSDQGDSQTE